MLCMPTILSMSRPHSALPRPAPATAGDVTADATTLPQMSAMSSTQAGGATAAAFSLALGKRLLMSTPASTGRSTTESVDFRSATVLSGTLAPMSRLASSGVMKAAATVEQEVMSTLSATSPPPMSVTRLLAVPPGQHPTRMTPARSSAGSPAAPLATRPARGMKMYWHKKPLSTDLGALPTRLKSSTEMPMPMQSIVSASVGVTYGPNHVTRPGRNADATAAPSTHAGK
mmetsp:Transcript_20256/g.61479  ORF Transcript_20256/g.61479 Transcript_20256/m.61479 type:complete len:230 (-) Transcript_20256:89-778(-)